jgi:chorismate-pyruvate lyase
LKRRSKVNNSQLVSVDTIVESKIPKPIQILSDDLQLQNGSHVDPSILSTFQKILLTTDGTVTDILEAYLFEQIRVSKLSEKLIKLSHDIPPLELREGNEVILREVLLKGRISRKCFIYAESIIVPERIDERFKEGLLDSKLPIGKLWFEHKVETFKEILSSRKENADNLANYFCIKQSEQLLSRTYRVMTNRKPVMVITEKFPESYFLKVF